MKQAEKNKFKWLLLGFLCLLAVALMTVGIFAAMNTSKGSSSKTETKPISEGVSTYEQCIATPGSVMLLTYPEQCSIEGKTFTNPAQKL